MKLSSVLAVGTRVCLRSSPSCAFRLARSRGINVLEALQASLCYVGHTQGNLGIEAMCHFLRGIGVGFDPAAMLERPYTDKSNRSWSDCPRPEELTCDGASAEKGAMSAIDTSHCLQALSRPKEGIPPTQASMPRQQSCHAPKHLRENVPRPEPSRATQEQRYADGRTQQDERNCVSCVITNAPDPVENKAAETRVFVDEAPPNRRQEYASDDGSKSGTKVVASTTGNVCIKCGNRPVGNSNVSVESAAPFDNGPWGNR